MFTVGGADTKAKVFPSRSSSSKGLVHSNNAYKAVIVNRKAAIKTNLRFHVIRLHIVVLEKPRGEK